MTGQQRDERSQDHTLLPTNPTTTPSRFHWLRKHTLLTPTLHDYICSSPLSHATTASRIDILASTSRAIVVSCPPACNHDLARQHPGIHQPRDCGLESTSQLCDHGFAPHQPAQLQSRIYQPAVRSRPHAPYDNQALMPTSCATAPRHPQNDKVNPDDPE